jgi:hypothetical protein
MSNIDFDWLTQAVGETQTRREAVRRILSLVGASALAPFGVACGGNPVAPEEELPECGTASSCGDRHNCMDDSGCICIRTAEGRLRCGRIPSCSVRRCTSSADCADLGAGYFCDSPNSGCCSETEQYCIAPCKAPPPPAFQMAAANNRDVLFSFNYLEHSTYYYGRRNGESLEVTHVAFNGRNGQAAVLIVNEDYLPVQWILPGATISVRRQDRSQPLDPRDALHFFATTVQETITADISTGSLRQVLNRAEEMLGQTFPAARQFLLTTTENPNVVVTRAREPGMDQPRLIAAAIAFRAAAALVALEAAASANPARPVQGQAAIASVALDAVSLGKMALTSLLGDVLDREFGPSRPENPNVPSIGVLLCQGATRMPPFCHYMFFLGTTPEPCVSFCRTDLGCFTNICMPMSLGLDDADNARNAV